MKDLNGIAYQWTNQSPELEGGRLPTTEQQRVGAREVLYGNMEISEKWNPERRIVLEDIDLLWFGVQLRRQLSIMGRMRLDEINFSDPEQRFDLLLVKEDNLFLIKNLKDRSQPTIRLDFREFKEGFGDFRQSLWQDILRRYPQIVSHPHFTEMEQHFR